MKRQLLFLLSAIMFLGACKDEETDYAAEEQKNLDYYLARNYPDLQPDADGLYTIPLKEGNQDGVKPLKDGYVLVEFTSSLISTNKENAFATTDLTTAQLNGIYKSSVHYAPVIWKVSDLIEGLKLGLDKMKEGAIYKFIIPSKLAYGSVDHGNIKKYSTIIMTVTLTKVIDNLGTYQEDLISNYATNNMTNAQDIGSGMYISVTGTGDGDKFVANNTVSTNYKGYFMDGFIFDESSEPLKVTIGEGKVIKGYEEALKHMKKGQTAKVIIPYQMGYGENGSGAIQPYDIIIFEITAL
ncbi:MAG: FKBP-type peptidyl-prolyl cis-trans isomerase [Bacteroidales bacterium]|nr:FKBP-type peptidyl-prolyl cis-trans isomerase [Bacteroidales bacterium]